MEEDKFSVGESEEEGFQSHGSCGGSRTQNSYDKETVPWYNQYTAMPTVQESLIYHVTQRINMKPSSVNGYGPTPWKSHGGRKVNYSVTIKASFGEYCLADTNSGDNSMEPSARGAITRYEASDIDSNWRVFHLESKRLVKRYELTLWPMPYIVINCLNDLHD